MVRRTTYCFPVCWREGIQVAYVDLPEDFVPEDIEVLQQFVDILRQSVAGRETRKEQREMESGMTAEETAEYITEVIRQKQEYLNFGNSVTYVQSVLTKAEERGYQRGKSEYRNDELFACYLAYAFMTADNRMRYACACGEAFPSPEQFNEHWRRSAVLPSLPCEWEDLKGLEGRALRERVASRAQVWRHLLNVLRDEQDLYDSHLDSADAEILIGLIQSKSQACEVEADRLWSIHLDSFEPLLDEPDGAAKIVAALGANYLPVIVDRAAAKRARAAETVTTINLNDNGILEPGHRAWLDLKGRQD